MAVLHPVVGPAADLLLLAIAELVHRRSIGTKTIGGDRFYRAVALQGLPDEGKGCLLVAGLGDITLKNFALLVDRTPQIVHLATHVHGNLVQMPVPVLEPLPP